MSPPRAPRIGFAPPADDATLPTTATTRFPWVYLEDGRLPTYPFVRPEDQGRRIELRGTVTAIDAVDPGTFVVTFANPSGTHRVRVLSGVPIPSLADGPLKLWVAGVIDASAPLGNIVIGDSQATMLYAAMSEFMPGRKTQFGDFTIAAGPMYEDLAPGAVEPAFQPSHYLSVLHRGKVGYVRPGEWRWIDGGDGGYFLNGVVSGASRDGKTPASLAFAFARPAPLPRPVDSDPNSAAATEAQVRRATALQGLLRELIPTLQREVAPELHAVLSERAILLQGAVKSEADRFRVHALVRSFFTAKKMIVVIDDQIACSP